MAKYLRPPPPGVLKINMHGTSSSPQSRNGYFTGIGAIYRDHNGELKYLTIGVIPELTPLDNQLWAIFVPLRRAFELGYKNIFLKTDNLEAFLAIRNFHIGAPTKVFDIVSQIYIRIHDERWSCMVSYVLPVRNRVPRFLSRLGKKICKELYTYHKAVGGVAELLEMDMSMGFDDPSYQDDVIPMEAADPVNFDVQPSDVIDTLRLGQIKALGVVVLDGEGDGGGNEKGVMMEEVFERDGRLKDDTIFVGDSIPVERWSVFEIYRSLGSYLNNLRQFLRADEVRLRLSTV